MPQCQAIAPQIVPQRCKQVAAGESHTSAMPRSILANNLRSLMDARKPAAWGVRELARKAGIDHKTVSRILDGSHAATIDTIAALSNVFSLCPWQMLVPDLRPDDPPVTQLSRTESRLYLQIRDAAAEFGKSHPH